MPALRLRPCWNRNGFDVVRAGRRERVKELEGGVSGVEFEDEARRVPAVLPRRVLCGGSREAKEKGKDLGAGRRTELKVYG